MAVTAGQLLACRQTVARVLHGRHSEAVAAYDQVYTRQEGMVCPPSRSGRRIRTAYVSAQIKPQYLYFPFKQ